MSENWKQLQPGADFFNFFYLERQKYFDCHLLIRVFKIRLEEKFHLCLFEFSHKHVKAKKNDLSKYVKRERDQSGTVIASHPSAEIVNKFQ